MNRHQRRASKTTGRMPANRVFHETFRSLAAACNALTREVARSRRPQNELLGIVRIAARDHVVVTLATRKHFLRCDPGPMALDALQTTDPPDELRLLVDSRNGEDECTFNEIRERYSRYFQEP